jgi:hypothetical protein
MLSLTMELHGTCASNWSPSGAQQGVTCPMGHEKLTIRE